LPDTIIKKIKKINAYLFSDFSFSPQALNYEWYWDENEKIHGSELPRQKLELISGIVDKESTVLEIGCGDGTLLHELIEKKAIRAKGVDISQKALNLAKAKGIEVKRADVTNSTFSLSETFDYIIASEVLEHLSNPEEVMLKFKDKFRKYLIITLPNSGFIAERLRLLFGRAPKQWAFHPSEHLHYWTPRDFIFWCRQLGFRVENSYGLFDNYYDLKVPLWRWFPKLFSRYMLYKVTLK
jgi:methionine biosynthesis protein MetW